MLEGLEGGVTLGVLVHVGDSGLHGRVSSGVSVDVGPSRGVSVQPSITCFYDHSGRTSPAAQNRYSIPSKADWCPAATRLVDTSSKRGTREDHELGSDRREMWGLTGPRRNGE